MAYNYFWESNTENKTDDSMVACKTKSKYYNMHARARTHTVRLFHPESAHPEWARAFMRFTFDEPISVEFKLIVN